MMYSLALAIRNFLMPVLTLQVSLVLVNNLLLRRLLLRSNSSLQLLQLGSAQEDLDLGLGQGGQHRKFLMSGIWASKLVSRAGGRLRGRLLCQLLCQLRPRSQLGGQLCPPLRYRSLKISCLRTLKRVKNLSLYFKQGRGGPDPRPAQRK